MPASAKTGPAEYPKEFERDVTLKNGMRVHVRAIRPDDAPRLSELYDRLSRHTLYQRFFTTMKRLPPRLGPDVRVRGLSHALRRRRRAARGARPGAGGRRPLRADRRSRDRGGRLRRPGR